MNHWDQRFRDKKYVYGTEPNVFLTEMQPKLHLTGDALAIAEGEGRNAVYLAEQGMNVTTWDFAKSGLEKTKKLAGSRGVSVQTQLVDLNEAQWQENQWDEIICVFGHFPPEVRKKALQGVKQSIKPGGYFVTEVYSHYQIPYNSGGPKVLDLLYAPEEFLHTFKDWRILHFFTGEVDRYEGELHNGLSHVIQFVGQKPVKNPS
ncbi:2-polyprenyl-3-methyl-5-hydroxy-6-metoxy-1,4-benzoquinol methylase [Oikeobacillus pervagus]|uniref:2-polyprenyl-3-methyl-5-hydroxy-6-metoxy-1, 4-benzoquinol methylase n=1 Tax=Oikeobacillus pervagus TaxID=1325931 RepID=A0AAJ1T3W5_9BACI|nr:class I SAM-dependent methyltransferase [Oikeobacillus pervagus]MDQ0214370.1 2-polyprenyl-3-methyl-5-hydroxy-6-metoxy-1,4-benzoquinol methylase [Oikeobacillus pervagus]